MSNDDLLPPAAPDTSDPLGMLRACHERILRNAETLERLGERVANEGVDAEVRKAAANVHRYFAKAGKHHHEDEEVDLFPLLARQSLKLADIVHDLRQDHERLDTLWEAIAPELEKPSGISDAAGFKARAEELAAAYREHITRENEELLDLAQHILGPDDLKRIGNAMAERRGLPTRYY